MEPPRQSESGESEESTPARMDSIDPIDGPSSLFAAPAAAPAPPPAPPAPAAETPAAAAPADRVEMSHESEHDDGSSPQMMSGLRENFGGGSEPKSPEARPDASDAKAAEASDPKSAETAGAKAADQGEKPPETPDQKKARFIEDFLQKKGSPAAGQGAGEAMVKHGNDKKVDPLALLAIGGAETGFGKTGIGANGMLGVGAYDKNPRNAVNNPTFSGVERQAAVGASTFAKLRAAGGANEDSPMSQQVQAAWKGSPAAGSWNKDKKWPGRVMSIYNNLSKQYSEFQ